MTDKPAVGPFDDAALLTATMADDWFDPEYYATRTGQKFGSTERAFSDYLSRSRFTEVNPSPKFDSLGYLRGNRSAYNGNWSPLAHFARNGFDTRLLARSIPLPPWKPSSVIPAASELDLKLRIAVHVHVHFPDLLPPIISALQALPFPVHVLASATSSRACEATRTALRQRCANIPHTVRMTPNRGRNFGPLLTIFADEARAFDLLCHVHTKKSLNTAREQTQWAAYLIHHLLGDTGLATQIVAAMQADPALGLVYPTSFPMLGSTANHWGRNGESGRLLLARLGIDRPAEGFLHFPAGAMFWSRPAALRQLLDGSWNNHDLPDEPLSGDGSVLHALERSLGPMCESNGFRQAWIDTQSRQLTNDGSFIYREYRKTPTGFERELDRADVISCPLIGGLTDRVPVENTSQLVAKPAVVAAVASQVRAGAKLWLIGNAPLTRKEVFALVEAHALPVPARIVLEADAGLRTDPAFWEAYMAGVDPAVRVTHFGPSAVGDVLATQQVHVRRIHTLDPMSKWKALSPPMRPAQQSLGERELAVAVADWGLWPFLPTPTGGA